MKTHYSTQVVAKLLETHFGRPIQYKEGDPAANVDGCVDVTPQVDVQVGDTYLMVVQLTKDNRLIFWPQRQSWIAMLQDLEKAIQQAAQE